MEFLKKEIIGRERTMQLKKTSVIPKTANATRKQLRHKTSFEIKSRKHSMPLAAGLETSNQRLELPLL